MTALPSNLPAGITEDDLIDLVDGALAPEREGAILAALRQDPSLATLAKSMRADRQSIGALGIVRAPSGLAEGVEARLEAAALRDLARASVAAPVERIPVSQIEPQEPGVLTFLLENVWARRLALAASLAIVAGAGALGVREVIKSRSPRPAGPIATNTTPTSPTAPEAGSSSTPTPEPEAIASTTTPSHATEAAPSPEPEPAPPVVAMTDERAAQLAREGRLVLSVRATDAAPSIKRLDLLAKAAGREGGWQTLAMDRVPGQYAMLLTPSMEVPGQAPAPRPLSPIVVADADPGLPAPIATKPEIPRLPPLRPAVKALYTVEIGPSDQAVRSLVRSITDGLPAGASIVLREVPQRPADEVSLDPDSIIWWTGTPSRWIKKIKVPVVVEGLE